MPARVGWKPRRSDLEGHESDQCHSPLATGPAQAQDATGTDTTPIPTRPAILFNRLQENWSVLADPRVPKEFLDSLKYIPLSQTDPSTYLSFGADVRERFEANDAAGFGTGPNRLS